MGRVGDRHPEASGFTLLELLVVLAIIGLMVTLIPGFMLRSQPQLDVTVAARAIANGLRQARSEAVVQNRSQVFALDVDARVFRSGDRPPVRIDDEIVLSFQTARSEILEEGVGQIRFFPDGSSTGGQISVSHGAWHAEVRSDWLTGLVTVDVTPG